MYFLGGESWHKVWDIPSVYRGLQQLIELICQHDLIVILSEKFEAMSSF
jgi:hypothetical protein